MLVSLVSITATNRPAPDAESGTIATRMTAVVPDALDGVESLPRAGDSSHERLASVTLRRATTAARRVVSAVSSRVLWYTNRWGSSNHSTKSRRTK